MGLGVAEERFPAAAGQRCGREICFQRGQPLAGGTHHTWRNRDLGCRQARRSQAIPRPFSKTNRLAFGPGGDRLVSGSLYPESEVRLWTTDGKKVHRQNVHRNSIFDLAYSPDGSRIASASLDQTIGLWHGATLQLVALLRGHTGKVLFVKFTPDSKRLLSMSDDQSIWLWDAARGDPVAVLHGHTGRINFFTLSPDGNTLASTSADGTVRLWDLKKTEARGGVRGHTSYVYDASFSPDGKQMASAAWDGTVRIWDTATLREVAVLKQETKGDPIVRCVAWSRDGRLLAAIAEPDFVHIWIRSNTGSCARCTSTMATGGPTSGPRSTTTAPCSQPAATTATCSCGIRKPATSWWNGMATTGTKMQILLPAMWRLAPTAGRWQPLAATACSTCGA